MASWRPNPGHPPVYDDSEDDTDCPADRIPASEAASARVMVRLANGREPPMSWPIYGRPIPTRWSRSASPFDIDQWRRA